MPEIPAIGIDLGTTYCCVAVYQYGQVKVIPNDMGSLTTPSYVGFTETECHIGEPAKNQIISNPTNTVYNVKRLIGRTYNENSVEQDIRQCPFKVINMNMKPTIQVQFKREEQRFDPEQISAKILEKLVKRASEFLGGEVKDVVITVPAYFNDAQRQSTKNAGKIANLNVLRVLNEPTAAALAYGFDKKNGKKENILIFDLGGGTFDVSIIEIENENFVAKSIGGDTHLGGEDFDNNLVHHLIEEFKVKSGVDVSDNNRCVQQLRKACENAKRDLSSSKEAFISLWSFYKGEDFCTKISRAMFEELNDVLFQKTIQHVEHALRSANLSKSDISEVVLVGGSSRIPKIRELLSEFFDGKQLCHSVDPDQAVAYGAAIHAVKKKEPIMKGLNIQEICPLSLGISAQYKATKGIMSTIIPRNSPIPLKQTKNYSTVSDNQECILIKVYEGERELAENNKLLGQFELTGIPLAPACVPSIQVTFAIDEDGILNVKAQEMSTMNKKEIVIKKTNFGTLREEEISNMIRDAEFFKEKDEQELKRINAKYYLESLCNKTKRAVENDKSNIKATLSEQWNLTEKYDQILSWLKQNRSYQDILDRTNTFKSECSVLLKKYDIEVE